MSSQLDIQFKHLTRTHRSVGRMTLFLLFFLMVGATILHAQIQTSVPSLTGFIQTDAISCPPQSYVVTGTNITADVVVTAPTGFEISTDKVTWVAPPASITISQNGPTTIPPTTIYVRLNTAVLGLHSGSISHTSTDAASVFLTVDGIRSVKSPTTSSVVSSLNPSVFGQSVTLTSNVTSPLPGTPTGTVTFMDGGTSLGTVALNGSAVASYSTSTLAFGPHDLTAAYNGDSQFDTSTSTILSQYVRGTTTTIVASNNNPSNSGESVQFTATVSSSYPGTPTGSVTFYDGLASLGSSLLSAGSASLSTSSLTPGSHSVTATYDGDVTFAGSTSSALSQMVKALTTTALSSNHNPSVSGQSVTMTATVSSITPGTITGTVSFFDAGLPVGSPVAISAGKATMVAAYAASSSPHSITATYNGDANYATSSASALNQVITQASTSPILSADHNPSELGQGVTFTAAITPVAPGGGIPSGTVVFTIDGTPSAPISMLGGSASITTSSLAIGVHAISASYSGDPDYIASTSSSYADTVNPIITATAGLHGSISPTGSVVVLYGSNQIFNILPSVGYAVDSLFIDGVAQAGAERDTFFNVTANHTIHATFIVKTQTVTVSAGTNGTASPLGDVVVLRGDSLVVTMLPDPHYHVTDVLLDNVSVGPALSYTLRDVTADHTIHVSFALNQYTLSVNVVGSGTVVKNPDSLTYFYGTNVDLSATPTFAWLFNGWSGDAGGAASPLTVFMDTNKTITATFTENPAYLALFRSFNPDSLALDKDNLGKIGKYVKRKGDKVYFSFGVTSPVRSHHLSLTLKFGFPTSGAILRGLVGSETLFTWTNLKTVTSPPLDTGLVFRVDGIGFKGKQVSVSFTWGTSPKTTSGKVVTYIRNDVKLPMPNRVNALFETFDQNGYSATSGLPVGIAKPESAKFYGWIRSAKYTDVLKTLYDKGRRHRLDNPRFLAYYDNSHLIKGLIKSLPPSKEDNGLAANLMTLRFNIVASQLGKTPPGYGELVYNGAPTAAETTANLFLQGKMISEIAAVADQVITGFYVLTTHGGNDRQLPVVNDVIRKLNDAFEGVLDTSDFSSKLQFKGTRRLIDVPYLSVNPGVVPTTLAPGVNPVAQVPDAYTLHQNYPNPFNPTTTISFELPEQALVTLKVYNMLGQEVATLVDHQLMEDGTQEFLFDGSQLASGVYFYRIIAQGVSDEEQMTTSFTTVKKMMLVK